jgi:2-methylcitrate dehydratase PrpD
VAAPVLLALPDNFTRKGLIMNDIDKRMIVEALLNNILNTRFEDLDQATVENAKKRINDVVGDIIGGAGAPDNAILVKRVKDWGGKKEASILGYGLKAPAPHAAWVNAILCNSFDCAPLVVIINNKRYPSHTSGATIPSAITMGERGHISGKELITCLVAAEDLVARLQSTETRRGPATTLGTAAITGRILGLNLLQMRNAFGIALDQGSGGTGGLWDGSPTFKTGYGKAAMNGIVAAQLAQNGWTAAEDPLFGEYGSYFGNSLKSADNLMAGLGKKYYVELVFKPYPGCRLTHAGIEAALALVGKQDFRVEEIAEITLVLPPSAINNHCWKPFQIRSYPTGDALFSYRYSIATVLMRKRVTNENFTEKFIRDTDILRLIDKIRLEDSPQVEGADLNIKLKNGNLISEYVKTPRGDISTALSRDELNAKFMTQVDFSKVINRTNAEKLLDMLDGLEEVDDISKITDLTVKGC